MKNRWHKLLAIISSSLLLTASPGVGMGNITCGQTVTESTTLTSDLTCPASIGQAITIINSDVTLDLGGHTLRGQAVEADTYGVLIEGWRHVERVRITNGTIEGFVHGIGVYNARDVIIDEITIKNFTTDDPNSPLTGVVLYLSQHVVVKDSRFEFHHNIFHRNAVLGGASDFIVRNIVSSGGSVSISHDCDDLSTPHYAHVLDNEFSNVAIGVWISCTNNASITGNTFTDCGNAVQGDAPFAGAITGLHVLNNVVTTSVSPALGIQFRGVMNSSVENNTVKGHDAWGITIGRSLGCIGPTPGWEDCFYSTNNIIRCNVALENGIDLYHDIGSTPNTWENNTCQTQQGVDIPPCNGHEKCLPDQGDFPWEIFMPAILHGSKQQ